MPMEMMEKWKMAKVRSRIKYDFLVKIEKKENMDIG